MRAVRSRLRGEREAGLGLTDLIVSMGVFAIIMVIVGSFFIQTGKITTMSNDNRRSATEAGNIFNALQTPVRVATRVPVSGGMSPAIQEAKKDTVTVIAMTDVLATDESPVATKYVFTVTAAGALTVKRCALSVSAGGIYTPSSCNSPSTYTVGTGVQSTTAFTFNNSSGTPIAFVSGAIPAASLDSIASITITMQIKSTGTGQPAVPVSSTVLMPNLGLTSS